MMKDYFVVEPGASPHGPYSETMVRRAFKHGMYPPDTKIWWAGAENWTPVEYVFWGGAVKQAEPQSAPPPPPPPPPSGYTNTPYMPPPAATSSGWNVINAFTCNMKRYAHFEGRSCKSEYWYFILAQIILGMLLLCFGEAGIVAYFLVGLALFVPNMVIWYRRLQDAGYEGTAGAIICGILNFIGLCTFFVEELLVGDLLGMVAIIVIGCTPSKIENNPYGAAPQPPI